MTILRNGVNHIYAQLHTAVGVVRAGVRNPTDTVVTVAKQFNPQTVVLVGQLVKPAARGYFCFYFLILCQNTSSEGDKDGELFDYLAKSSLRRRMSSSAVH